MSNDHARALRAAREKMSRPEVTNGILLAKLVPNDRNPRHITDEALHTLCESIKNDPQFMELRPIVVDEEMVILGGNQRYRACTLLGYEEVPSSWVKVARGLTPEQRAKFVVIDNSPEGMAGQWDFDILQEDYDIPVLESLGFIFPELQSDEIRHDEWAEAGMPEHEHKEIKPHQQIIVRFTCEGDVQKFAKAIKQNITPQTRAIYFPKQDFDSQAREIFLVNEKA